MKKGRDFQGRKHEEGAPNFERGWENAKKTAKTLGFALIIRDLRKNPAIREKTRDPQHSSTFIRFIGRNCRVSHRLWLSQNDVAYLLKTWSFCNKVRISVCIHRDYFMVNW